MTYYKYKARDLDKSMIDWSGLTKTISDGLMKEKEKREAKKQELEKSHQDQLKQINEYEQGLDPTLNKLVMQESQQTRDFLMENHRLMKQGVRSVNDAKLIKQNVTDGWSSLNNAIKSYNVNFERLSSADGKLNDALLEQLSKQLNLSNKKIYWDENGNGFWADSDAKGNIDMNTIVPLKAISNTQSQSYDVFDVNKKSDDVAKNVADWTVFINDTNSITDARQNKAYNSWINNTANSALSSDEQIASILLDYLNLDYNIDGNPTIQAIDYDVITGYDDQGRPQYKTESKQIPQIEFKFDKNTGTYKPDIKKEHEDLARAVYINAIEAKIGRKAAKRTPPGGNQVTKLPKANQGNIDKLMRSMMPTPNQFDPGKMDPPNELLVRNNVQNIARDLKLDQQKVTVSGGKVFYNNVEIGDINTSTAQDIVDKLNSYANPNQGPMSIHNP